MLRLLTGAGRAMMIGLPAAGPGPVASVAQAAASLGIWLPVLAILALLAAVAALASFAMADWRSYRLRGPGRSYRYRRSAHERFAPSVELQRQARAGAPPAAPPPAPPPYAPPSLAPAGDDQDELLRQLLGQ